jgi:nicotinamidase-related amidase
MPDPYVTPDYAAAGLVTIDVQADTLDGEPLEVPGTSAALQSIGLLAQAFRDAGRPIVHVVRLYRRDGSNADPCRRAAIERGAVILAPGEKGCQLAEGVALAKAAPLDPGLLLGGGLQELGPGEVAMYKPRWGAFYETPLERHLQEVAVTTVVFCGCNFPNCPRTSIYEASERDFRIAVATDALSGIYERGLRELEGIGVELGAAEQLARTVREAAGERAA